MLSIQTFVNSELSNYDNMLWEYIKSNYNNINEKNGYIYEINYLINRGLLEISPITNNLSEIFENDYIILYSDDNDYYLNEGKGQILRKGVAVVGKVARKGQRAYYTSKVGKNIEKGRRSLNSSRIGRNVNMSNAGINFHKTKEGIKNFGRDAKDKPVATAKRVGYDTIAVAAQSIVDPNPIGPLLKLKQTDEISKFMAYSQPGKDAEKIARKEIWRGIKKVGKGIKTAAKHPIETAKKAKETFIKHKPEIIRRTKEAAKKTKETIKNHPIETGAHIATQVVSPIPSLPTAITVHSAANYARENKGQLSSALAKDSKEAGKKLYKGTRRQLQQAKSSKIPTEIISKSKLSQEELKARDLKIEAREKAEKRKESFKRAQNAAKKMKRRSAKNRANLPSPSLRPELS